MDLFDHPLVNEFEEAVAQNLGCTVYSENKDIIGNLVRKEIELCNIASNVLINHFTIDKEELKRFTILAYASELKIDDGEEYPEDEEIQDSEKSKTIKTHGPGIGFGITYSIYFHFLMNDQKYELARYLKARKIPFSNKFCNRLTEYFDEIRR